MVVIWLFEEVHVAGKRDAAGAGVRAKLERARPAIAISSV